MKPDKQPTDLDSLATYAEGYAEFAMKNSGRVPPTMLGISPEGLQHFIPESLEDELRGLAVAGALIRSKAA